jgi:hypothetical protein
VIDISNPTSPQRIGGYDTSGFACDVALSGSLVYVADGSGGLQAIDVSDPTQPKRVGGNSVFSVDGVYAVAGRLFVSAVDDGLQIFELRPYFRPPLRDGQGITLSWEGFGGAVRLERATILSAPDWQSWPGSETVTNITLPLCSPGEAFFRLVRP